MFTNIVEKQACSSDDRFLLTKTVNYLESFRSILSNHIDRRLVRTFYDLFMCILLHRERHMGLLLSELGGYIMGHDRAPAGTKRISNLLRCSKWGASLVDQWLFERSQKRIGQLLSDGIRPLLLWDESVVEKAESWFSEGLCPVFSSKSRRLSRIRKGFYKPPPGRVHVPGYKWNATMLSGLGQIPSVCHMAWWTDRGKFKEWGGNIVYRMLAKIHEQIGKAALHVFDRGYANSTMLGWLFKFDQEFLIRWKSNHLLINQLGQKKQVHLLARSYISSRPRVVLDKQRKTRKLVSLGWGKVFHPEYKERLLSILIVRDNTFRASPMYLLTSLPIESPEQAWEICFSYFHRWNVEQAFRFSKAELGIEAPRMWFWENRLKMMAIVTLVFDFLLQMVRNWRGWVFLYIQKWCRRTGNKLKKVKNPIYRLRMAISRCLQKEWYLHQFAYT